MSRRNLQAMCLERFGKNNFEDVYYNLVPDMAKVFRLPSEYQEVEYIESSGTQYIDSGVKGTQNTKIELGFEMVDTTNTQYLFGACLTYNTNALQLSLNKANDRLYRVFYGSPNSNYGNVQNYYISFSQQTNVNKCVLTNTKITLDEEEYPFSYPYGSSFTTPNNMFIFARNNNGTIDYYASYKLKYFKLYDNGTLVRSFVPCYRKSDSVIGLYDLVNNVFYTNAGTGTFTKGNDVTRPVLDSGKGILGEIIGNGEIKNQLNDMPNMTDSSYFTTNGYGSVNCSNNILTYTCTDDTTGNVLYKNSAHAIKFIPNHHYFFVVEARASNLAKSTLFQIFDGNAWRGFSLTNSTSFVKYTSFITFASNYVDNLTYFRPCQINSGANIGDTIELKNLFVIDLTHEYGPGNEPTSVSDNRVQKILNEGYREFNTGSYSGTKVGFIEFEQYNLLSLDRTQGTLTGDSNTTIRYFEDGKYYVGLSSNNYYNNAGVSSYSISNNQVVITTASSGYGVALPMRVIAGQTYTLEFVSSNSSEVYKYVSWYDRNGNHISYNGNTTGQFTAPTNAYWGVVILRPDVGVTTTYSNLAFHRTGTRTGYAPHKTYLPSLYQEVEYIESHGTEWIDTGFKPNQDTTFRITFQLNSISTTQGIFGVGDGDLGKTYRLGVSSNGYFYFAKKETQFNGNNGTSNTNKNTFEFKNDKVYLNGNEYVSITDTTSYQCENNAYVFFFGGSTSIIKASGKLFELKIYDNGTLVHNFVPCYRRFDSVIGLYDTVNNVFYTNSGTGTFAKGKDVISNKIVLPATLELDGAINSHDKLTITVDGYEFTRDSWKLDLGTIDYTYDNGNNTRFYSSSTYGNTIKAPADNNQLANIICDKYTTLVQNQFLAGTENNSISLSQAGRINIRNTAYTDPSTFKTAMSGVYLRYQLATPQTIKIPFKHLGVVDLGSLNWNYDSTNQRFISSVALNNSKVVSSSADTPQFYCDRYLTTDLNHQYNNLSISQYTNGNLYIKDYNFTNAADFKNAMSGFYLFYETASEVEDVIITSLVERGGTVNTYEYEWAENQLCADNFVTIGYWGRNRVNMTVNNNIGTFVSNANSYPFVSFYKQFPANTLIIKDHYYLSLVKVRLTSGLCSQWKFMFHNNTLQTIPNPSLNTWYQLCGVVKNTNENSVAVNVIATQRTYASVNDIVIDSDSFEAKDPMLIDLTLGFGPGNEPTSINDPRIQDIIEKGYIPTNTTGTLTKKQTETLCDLTMKLQTK